ncbi:MAG: cysteine desulfurase family protein [Acidimicrobiales bacterium]
MPVYLDHAATTPMHPEAVEAMLPFLFHRFGNPSGSHAVAREARKALEESRDVVADCLGAHPGEIVFTAGGTEADNLAVIGHHAVQPGRVVCSAVEHHAVLHACAALDGVVAPVAPSGVIDLDALSDLLDPGVSLVSVMLANNEVGTVQPLAEVVDLVRRRAPTAVVHTDAVQAFPWLDVTTLAASADMVAVSAHKFGGPKGVGALVVRDGVKVAPILHGGGQERDRRSGTHNVAAIVGMAAAMQATVVERDATARRVGDLRDRLVDGLLATVPDSAETGDRSAKVAGNAHLSFGGIESEALLVLLDGAGVCASAGSACTSGAMEASHVLVAMGIDRDRALGSLRLSLGATSSDVDVDRALAAVPAAVARLRAGTQAPPP